MPGPRFARKYGTTSPSLMGDRSDIIKAGRKNTYRANKEDSTTGKNPAALYKFRGAPVKKIGTPFRFHEVEHPHAGFSGKVSK
jgi:hypothetical protein